MDKHKSKIFLQHRDGSRLSANETRRQRLDKVALLLILVGFMIMVLAPILGMIGVIPNYIPSYIGERILFGGVCVVTVSIIPHYLKPSRPSAIDPVLESIRQLANIINVPYEELFKDTAVARAEQLGLAQATWLASNIMRYQEDREATNWELFWKKNRTPREIRKVVIAALDTEEKRRKDCLNSVNAILYEFCFAPENPSWAYDEVRKLRK